MVNCIEEEYEKCLLKSVINELNTSFDATKSSSLDLSPSSYFDDDSDVSKQNLTKKDQYLKKQKPKLYNAALIMIKYL